MSTILVTGGAGYIGSHVVKELLRQGHDPIVFDNLQTGHRKATDRALFMEGNLSDQKKLSDTFQANSIDAVMHFAGDCLVGKSVQDPVKYFNNNVKNGIKLIEIIEQLNLRKFVFSSSAAVYDEPREIPIGKQLAWNPGYPGSGNNCKLPGSGTGGTQKDIIIR